MRVPIISIGNSKGIRLPQAVLKQASIGEEVDLEIRDGRITLKRAIDTRAVPDFQQLASLDDRSIQMILRKITGADLMTALIGTKPDVKDAVYRNLSPRVRDYLEPTVERLENGDILDLLVERSRNLISEVWMEVLNE